MTSNQTYRALRNEYDDGASKSMIQFTDTYVELGEYDDTFSDFLTYLHDVEKRLSSTELNRFNKHPLS